ncbi:Shedu anti-phage system protein SduA domain-containing protein [Mycobacteroides abscessus]|uniref:Shedu anti-phage system protein SduA domain-containing protein n=1 Tax=Mycobacteroides abscessus TaxID=36809 RepID=UPI000C264776|nr:Shedu anti-phage system protein SduA domain-containing protein [Mycobacteroides abscessus]
MSGRVESAKMTPRWQQVADLLDASIAGPTDEQLKLAGDVGVKLPKGTPALVAAHMLRQHLDVPLALYLRNYGFNDDHLDRLMEYAKEANVTVPKDIGGSGELDCWFRVVFAAQRARSLRELRLEIGDIVAKSTSGTVELFEVSSISDDGIVYFRGVGQRAYPDQIVIHARASDKEYKERREQAANYRTRRADAVITPSSRALDDLDEYRIDKPVTEAARMFLRMALHSAEDEKPLQKVLENHPELLASLMPRNHGAWVIPQKRFGDRYVADFLVAGLDSHGLKWLLVELESPTALFYTQDGSYRQELRKGIRQIKQWRRFIELNLATARQRRRDDGLGLPGIRSNSPGLVLIGRRAHLDGEDDYDRQDTEAEHNIRIHTYDWLVQVSGGHDPMEWGGLYIDDNSIDFGLPVR